MRLTLHTLNETVSRPSVSHWCSLSQQLLDAPPPHKRRMALWQIDDGHAAARNVKELFCRFRETSFAPAVQDLFSKISRNEKKRCHHHPLMHATILELTRSPRRSKWATPAESIQEPEIPRLGHETDPHNGNISVNHGAYVRDNELEQSPELEPVELEFSPTQTFGQIGEADGLANRLAGDKDAHEEMVSMVQSFRCNECCFVVGGVQVVKPCLPSSRVGHGGDQRSIGGR